MTEKDKTEKNLKQVQRTDPKAVSIITQATHVALYKFDLKNLKTNGWCKDDVEGCLFVYRRSEEPHYAVMIANRNNPKDFVLPVIRNLQMQEQPPYIYVYRPDGEGLRREGV